MGLAILASDLIEAIVTGQQPGTIASDVIARNPHHMLRRDQWAILLSR